MTAIHFVMVIKLISVIMTNHVIRRLAVVSTDLFLVLHYGCGLLNAGFTMRSQCSCNGPIKEENIVY